MASPGRDPQRSFQAWRILNESFRMFATKAPVSGRRCLSLQEQQGLNDALGLCVINVSGVLRTLYASHMRLDVNRTRMIVEQSQMDIELKNRKAQLWRTQCELRNKRFEIIHQRYASAKMTERLEKARRTTRLLEERHRKLDVLAVDKGELYTSRSVMLCSRMFDLTQEVINTKMRINSFEQAKAHIKRRILELQLRRIRRRRQLCEEVQLLRQVKDQWQVLMPPMVMRVWQIIRGWWDCVGSLGLGCHSPHKMQSSASALNLFVACF
ncbi:uncharacterized protein [Drosophila bipectinata]|uniref:uncharacterized protein n=1 Tax=Drosophila bipectinata TaxID=42026 RepID=UPI001C8A2A25|nr:uncharacterized protein LOC108124097 [Drosophila bipectinata]